ncbi:MAG: metalloregulator ArsR/SmtB family transcription factor [candidate division Zixibacteria bacterium]
MTTEKNHEFFKALSDPTRLRIVALLVRNELCVCDLTEVLGLPQPTISRHMSLLKAARLVSDRREGKWVHYQLTETEPLEDLRPYMTRLGEFEPHLSDLTRLHEYQKVKMC